MRRKLRIKMMHSKKDYRNECFASIAFFEICLLSVLIPAQSELP